MFGPKESRPEISIIPQILKFPIPLAQSLREKLISSKYLVIFGGVVVSLAAVGMVIKGYKWLNQSKRKIYPED